MQASAPPDMTPKDLFAKAHNALRMGDVLNAFSGAAILRHHFPDDAPIKALHGVVLHEVGSHIGALSDMGDALHLVDRALEEGEEEDPNRPRIMEQKLDLKSKMGLSLAHLGQLSGAEKMLDEALEIDPDRAGTLASKARVLAMGGRSGEALALIEESVGRYVEETPLRIVEGLVLGSSGDADAAALKACGERLAALSETPNTPAGTLMQILRSHGAVRDAERAYDDAYALFRRAAKLGRGSYDATAHAAQSQAVIEHWTADALASLVRPEEPFGAGRVMLCGTPASGVLELESLLRLVPGMFSIGPMETLGTLANREFKATRGTVRPFVKSPQGIRGDQLRSLAERYNASCSSLANAPGVVTVDTHPHNTPLLGLAAAAMPGMCVVLCRRGDMDSTLNLFAPGVKGNHSYVNDLVDTASFVRDTGRLQDHWRATLGDERLGVNVVEVAYEEITGDPQGVVERVASASGLGLAPQIDAGAAPKRLFPSLSADDYAGHMKKARSFFEAE